MASTAAMKTAPMGTTSKARPPAGGKASDVSAVIKATERSGARSWLKVRSRGPVESATMVEAAMAGVAVIETVMAEITVAVAEVTMMEPVVTKIPAVGGPFVMIEECSPAMPVVVPVMPAPPKSSEEADTKSNAKGKAGATPKNPRHGIPARVRNDRRTIHQPGVVGGNVNDLRVGRFDDDCVALRRYLFLFVVIQMAGTASLLTQGLAGIGHSLRLRDIGFAKGRGP